MLAKLKTALSLAPTVEYLDYEDGLLAVRSKKVLKTDITTVKLKTSFGKVLARIKVDSYDAEHKVYRLKVLEQLRVPAGLRIERRRHERLAKVVRVTSQSFPGFTGMTEDISVSGLRVNIRGALESGKEIAVTLELDDERIEPIFLRTHVAWCAQKADGRYQAGLKITGIHPAAEQQIASYIKTRLAIEKKLHTLEEIDPFDVM